MRMVAIMTDPPRIMARVMGSSPRRTEKKLPNRHSVDRKMAAFVELVLFCALVWMRKQRQVLNRPRYNAGRSPVERSADAIDEGSKLRRDRRAAISIWIKVSLVTSIFFEAISR